MRYDFVIWVKHRWISPLVTAFDITTSKRGNHLTKLGVAANHALRCAYAREGRAAAVPRDSIRRFLNHAGDDVTDHYIRNSALDEWQLAEHETISAHIIKALGSSAWVSLREHAA
jgi:hypothetical protein